MDVTNFQLHPDSLISHSSLSHPSLSPAARRQQDLSPIWVLQRHSRVYMNSQSNALKAPPEQRGSSISQLESVPNVYRGITIANCKTC